MVILMADLSAQPQWFHFFRDIVRTGLLSKMDGSTLKVYVSVKAHSNHQSGEARPTQQTIARESGLSVATVKRSISQLEKFGLLQKNKTQRKNNSYFLNEKIQVMSGEDVHSEIDFRYIPSRITQITKKIKDSIAIGELPNSNSINTTINVLGQGIQINGCQAMDENEISKIWEENGGHQ